MTDGGFTPDGDFVRVPPSGTVPILRSLRSKTGTVPFSETVLELLLTAWQTNVFNLLLAAGKIDEQTVANMRSWTYSGFSVDNSVYLAPGDTFGLERLAQYILRCPFSRARIVRVTDDGSVLYRAETGHCRRFPGPASADLRGGPKRNFQVFSALDFLAELTQHIPDKGSTWCATTAGIRTAAAACAPRAPPRDSDAASELILVPDAEFLESERLEARPVGQSAQRPELQLVLDPEFL